MSLLLLAFNFLREHELYFPLTMCPLHSDYMFIVIEANSHRLQFRRRDRLEVDVAPSTIPERDGLEVFFAPTTVSELSGDVVVLV